MDEFNAIPFTVSVCSLLSFTLHTSIQTSLGHIMLKQNPPTMCQNRLCLHIMCTVRVLLKIQMNKQRKYVWCSDCELVIICVFDSFLCYLVCELFLNPKNQCHLPWNKNRKIRKCKCSDCFVVILNIYHIFSSMKLQKRVRFDPETRVRTKMIVIARLPF